MVYFDFFCSKLISTVVDRTLYKSSPNQTKPNNPVPMKAEVQVLPMAVYFPMEISFVVTFVVTLEVTER